MQLGAPDSSSDRPKYLMVASTGGHLAQLNRIAGSMDVRDDSLWVTFDTPQSRALLAGRRVLTVPYVSPRDWRGVLRATRMILRGTRGESFDGVVSTGAALAVAGFLAAKVKHVPRLYIESISRVQGPSMTGRLVAALRLASLQTQHRGWAGERWRYRGSVLASYATEPATDEAARDVVEDASRPRLFVSLGTIKPYRFDAAVDAVLATGLASSSTVWQLGVTSARDLPGRAVAEMTGEEFERCAREADVVITHAGVGTVMQLLDWGIRPVVLVRRVHRGEHVDDHQTQIAALLREHGLATVVDEPSELTDADVTQAAGVRVVVQDEPDGPVSPEASQELTAASHRAA